MPDRPQRSKPFSVGSPLRTVGAPVLLLACAATMAPSALAGAADILSGEIVATGDGRYRVAATVRHADTGWDHYADRFDVVAPDGTVLGSRVLHHPHVAEQPFTRSLRGVAIPPGIDRVTLRAHDSVHGLGGATIELAVPER